jgi:predicted RNase H-like nuclease (RuvC/YqgF family)
MELNYSEIFNKTILKSVSEYCKLNNIEDVGEFIKKCFDTGFNIEKYGLLGKTLNEGEKHLKISDVEEKQLIKEVIVEKRVEVPVEVIKEVEKIVEVIKEVPVEKIVTKIEYISDKNTENNLNETITKKDEEISKLNQTLDELRRNLDINVDDNKVKMLQQTIQNLNTEIRELKNKNEELNKKLLEQPKQVGDIPARFHGSSNLNDDLYK